MGKFNSGGKHSFLRHADSDGHKRVSDGRKGQIPGQRALVVNVREDGEDNNRNIQGRREVGEGEGSLQSRILASQKLFEQLGS